MLLLSEIAGRWLCVYKVAATDVMSLHTTLAVIFANPIVCALFGFANQLMHLDLEPPAWPQDPFAYFL